MGDLAAKVLLKFLLVDLDLRLQALHQPCLELLIAKVQLSLEVCKLGLELVDLFLMLLVFGSVREICRSVVQATVLHLFDLCALQSVLLFTICCLDFVLHLLGGVRFISLRWRVTR